MVKNIVFLEAVSIPVFKDILEEPYCPVLKFKLHLPEIIINGYRVKKQTKALYVTIDTSNVEEFKVFSDTDDLKAHLERVDIIKHRIDEFTISKMIVNCNRTVATSILNGLIVKTVLNYLLMRYSDYDGFNIGTGSSEDNKENMYELTGKTISTYSSLLYDFLKEIE